MGLVDIKIDVMRESHWRKWNSRVRSFSNSHQPLSDRSNSDASEENSPDQSMEHELYWAGTNSSPAELMAIIETVRCGRGQFASIDDVLRCVSPLGNTLLHVAAGHGNSSVVRHLTRLSVDIVTRGNYNGDTALHLAAEAGHVEIVKELIMPEVKDLVGAGDDRMTRVKNEQGNTALHQALIGLKEAAAWSLVQADPEAMFCLNNEEKSCLYLAAEAGYNDIIRHTLKLYEEEENRIFEMVKGRPPVHAAILSKHMGSLRILVEKEPRLGQSRDEEGRTPLHIAALTGYFEGVEYLLSIHALGAVLRDRFGFFPVHCAAAQGWVDVVEILLRHSPHPVELLDRKRRNVLHIAAENGRKNVVIYILENLDCGKLINAKDQDGNTPLHLATMNWHPRIVSALTWIETLDSSLTNNDGLTALDAAEFYMEGLTSFHQRLTWTALIASGAPRGPPMSKQNFPARLIESTSPSANVINYKDRVNTLLVVSTLIATITFAAGFTVPGGYKSSDDPHRGQATMLRKTIFSLFIICNTIAMHSAMIVTVSMIWAQLGDLNLVLVALRLGLRMLGVSLTMMSVAFMAGIYAAVGDLHWLANGVIVMGTVFVVALSALSFPLCFPISSKTRFWRYVSYYPFHLLMYVTSGGASSNR